jgi:hypothetical protein
MLKGRVFKGYKIPATYHLSTHKGNGCFLEPPNHPRYFTQSIYTGSGNSPRYGLPQYYLNGNGYTELEDVDRLYKPLSLEHERTQEWIKYIMSYFNHCYMNPDKPANVSDNTIIYPVPYYKLKTFTDDERFSDEWRAKEKASVTQANKEIEEQAKALAIPDNHQGVRFIRKYYPEFKPTDDLINNAKSYAGRGDWWTTEKTRPTPETCKGEDWQKHPVNGKWCQVCGWHEEA